VIEIFLVLLPLLGAIISGVLAFTENSENTDRIAQWVTCIFMCLASLLAGIVFWDVAINSNPHTLELFTWIESGALKVSWAIKLDTLSAIMLFMVTTVSTVIHVYSIGYMHRDKSIPRFMSYLSLFTFFMLLLVSSDNLVQLFFGWEGVGLASYLLIGFWYDRPAANAAAIKAFVVNRVGDFGFAIGIFAIFIVFQSVDFDTIFAAVSRKSDAQLNVFGFNIHAITFCAIFLFIGAMGKSAQLGLHTWLPDAMEGPTPVSALIHAATMVTAGVFMVCRMSPLFEYSDFALSLVTIIGASTCIFAATVACVQNDIKRVIAYSTCSQLGYMFFAAGISAYSAGMFHLVTHAFFKALLFLGAGSVIHAMSKEQDMRKMGGIWKKLPVTYALIWIGSLALAGIWPFSGYFSKDVILEATYAAGTTTGSFAFCLGIVAAFLTAFYSWRLLILTFHGQPRADKKTMAQIHESPKVMIIPLMILAAGAMFMGYLGYESFVGYGSDAFWGKAILVLPSHPALVAAHDVPQWVKLLPISVSVAGIALACCLYVFIPKLPEILAIRFSSIYRFLCNKWYFDELYNFIFVRQVFLLGHGFWKGGDGAFIDGVGPNGIAAAVKHIARKVGAFQTGYLFHYALAMLSGVVVLVTWYLLKHSG
jgi:NADH-quinone oxidoreductase subunit L